MSGQRPSVTARKMPTVMLACAAFTLCVSGSCRQESGEPPTKEGTIVAQRPVEELLVFPAELRVEDQTVNEFVARAMSVCALGDYEKFRLIWSASHDPLPRDEYAQGWQAVQRIRVQALERVILAGGAEGGVTGGDNAYVLLADVDLDPAHQAAKGEPHREVVMMLVREQGDWRLAHAPKGLRTWVKDKLGRVP